MCDFPIGSLDMYACIYSRIIIVYQAVIVYQAPQTIDCFTICCTFTPSVGSFTSPGTPDRRGEWLIMSHLKDTCRQSEVNEKATEGLNV